MAWQVKALASNPEDPTSTPGSHKVKRENRPSTSCHSDPYINK